MYICIVLILIFHLGLGGTGKLIEIGGPAFLLPLAQKDKIYDIQYILKQLNYNENAFIIGAGAGPWPQLSRNCEVCNILPFNLSFSMINIVFLLSR